MKSFIVLGLIGVCTVLMAGNSALAVVGGGDDHDGGGGGKNNKKHKMHMKNMEPEKRVYCWIRPRGEKRPKTDKEWKAKWTCINAKGSAHLSVKEGWCECTVIGKNTKKDKSYTRLIHMDKDKHYCCDKTRIWEEGKRPPKPPKGGGGGKGGGGKGGGGKGGGGKGGPPPK